MSADSERVKGDTEAILVMELVEGEALKGPLPVTTALEYARAPLRVPAWYR
jgi:hypothetical protein